MIGKRNLIVEEWQRLSSHKIGNISLKRKKLLAHKIIITNILVLLIIIIIVIII